MEVSLKAPLDEAARRYYEEMRERWRMYHRLAGTRPIPDWLRPGAIIGVDEHGNIYDKRRDKMDNTFKIGDKIKFANNGHGTTLRTVTGVNGAFVNIGPNATPNGWWPASEFVLAAKKFKPGDRVKYKEPANFLRGVGVVVEYQGKHVVAKGFDGTGASLVECTEMLLELAPPDPKFEKFKKGDRVLHTGVFSYRGIGTVEECRGGGVVIVRFDRDKGTPCSCGDTMLVAAPVPVKAAPITVHIAIGTEHGTAISHSATVSDGDTLTFTLGTAETR